MLAKQTFFTDRSISLALGVTFIIVPLNSTKPIAYVIQSYLNCTFFNPSDFELRNLSSFSRTGIQGWVWSLAST